MKTSYPLILLVVFFLFSCENQKTNGDVLPALSGGEFILTADRVALHPDVQFPHDTLTESDYETLETHINYNVTFSADGITVTISDSICGSRISHDPDCSKYQITEGLFAGGRFLVWKSDDHYEVEYTIYGSGVPVIRSERGVLREQ